MATENGPDLSSAVEAIEALMDDTCIIVRDPEGTLDSVLDEETGDLEEPDGQPVLVYEGKCKVSKSGNQMQYSAEAGRAVPVKAYSGSIPISAPFLPAEGDTLTVTSSRRDPELVDKRFRVSEVVVSTFAVQRRFDLEWRGEDEEAEILLTEEVELLVVEG